MFDLDEALCEGTVPTVAANAHRTTAVEQESRLLPGVRCVVVGDKDGILAKLQVAHGACPYDGSVEYAKFILFDGDVAVIRLGVGACRTMGRRDGDDGVAPLPARTGGIARSEAVVKHVMTYFDVGIGS